MMGGGGGGGAFRWSGGGGAADTIWPLMQGGRKKKEISKNARKTFQKLVMYHSNPHIRSFFVSPIKHIHRKY